MTPDLLILLMALFLPGETPSSAEHPHKKNGAKTFQKLVQAKLNLSNRMLIGTRRHAVAAVGSGKARGMDRTRIWGQFWRPKYS